MATRAARCSSRAPRWRAPGVRSTRAWSVRSCSRSASPSGWIADTLPFEDAADSALAFISPDDDLPTSRASTSSPPRPAPAAAPRRSRHDQFDPLELGVRPKPAGKLEKLLVTGDSLSLPLDSELAKRLTAEGRQGRARPARGHGDLEGGRGGLGQALRPAGGGPQARRRGGLHRRQRGLLRCPGPAGSRSSAAARTGRRCTPGARGG